MNVVIHSDSALKGRASFNRSSKRRAYFLAGLWAILAALSSSAAPLDAAIQTDIETQAAGASSHKQVEKLDDATHAMVNEYRQGIAELESLRSYHEQLQKEVQSQDRERRSLDKQLAEIEVTQRHILPLMLRMREVLQEYVSLDAPFLQEERSKRVAELRSMMDRSDVDLAEKYRRLMEAYQVETEYGRTIEAYRGDLKGKNQTVDFLRFGRLGLYYLTLDRREVGYWNKHGKAWAALPLEYRNAIEQGLRIARKQAAPDLLKLPVPSPERGTAELRSELSP
ncbi:MAG: DUF3450 domain-containing protein [Gammaproteobacteria bacterium]